jgi:hypothetical protein
MWLRLEAIHLVQRCTARPVRRQAHAAGQVNCQSHSLQNFKRRKQKCENFNYCLFILTFPHALPEPAACNFCTLSNNETAKPNRRNAIPSTSPEIPLPITRIGNSSTTLIVKTKRLSQVCVFIVQVINISVLVCFGQIAKATSIANCHLNLTPALWRHATNLVRFKTLPRLAHPLHRHCLQRLHLNESQLHCCECFAFVAWCEHHRQSLARGRRWWCRERRIESEAWRVARAQQWSEDGRASSRERWRLARQGERRAT